MKTIPLLVVLLLVVVALHVEGRRGPDRARRKRHLSPSEDLRPLRRSKRRWVLTTIVLEENDVGPFPKHAGDLFNDRSDNFSVKYLISGPGVDEPPEIGLFQVNDQTGQVYVNRPIDREKSPLFVVRFDAADRFTGKIIDKSLIFNVEVTDQNDNAPTFSQKDYNITLKETASLENPIFQVIAVDNDKPDTPNSQVTYSFISQIPPDINVKFSVDPKNGLIRGQGCLNSEASTVIRLLIGATDHGDDPLSSSCTVYLRIEDGNNNLPVFVGSEKIELTVPEGELNPELPRLKVEDKDTPKTPGWRAIYKILAGNEKGNFNLTTDPETNEGILSVVKPLNFEDAPTIKVVVSVENEEPYYSCKNNKLQIDKTATLSKATLSITVKDTNDAPVFSPPNKIIRETEGVKAGNVLGTYTANDPDRVPNKIKYRIANDPGGFLTIDENTGVVRTNQELDRESPFVNNTLYTVVVHAIDDGDPSATGTGTISLYISDDNDNTPELVIPYIERCQSHSSVPFTVEATDKDLEPYGGPFKFDVTDRSRSMQETWQVKQISDTSVEILMLRSLEKGNYTLPMEIYDRQGTSSSRVLHVRVCACPDGLNCEKMAPASYQLGGGAIGAMIGALLFLLLALFLLAFFCRSGKEKQILPNDDGNQTLIKYNEEGGSALSQATPATLLANANGNVEQIIKEKEAVGRSLSLPRGQHPQWESERAGVRRSTSLPRAHYHSWETDAAVGAGIAGSALRRSMQNRTWSQTSRSKRNESLKYRNEHMFVEKIGDMLNKRLHGIPTDDDGEDSYKPRIYAYEGDLERIDSIESFIHPEEMDFSFLDQFDPKFAKLEEICKK